MRNPKALVLGMVANGRIGQRIKLTPEEGGNTSVGPMHLYDYYLDFVFVFFVFVFVFMALFVLF